MGSRLLYAERLMPLKTYEWVWTEHKKIEALPIIAIYAPGPIEPYPVNGWTGAVWTLDDLTKIEVTVEMIDRGKPAVGDYYVEFANGRKAWVPAETFNASRYGGHYQEVST